MPQQKKYLASVATQISEQIGVPPEHVAKVLVFLKFEELERKAASLTSVLTYREGRGLFSLSEEDAESIVHEFRLSELSVERLRVAIRGTDATGTLPRDLVA